MSRSQPDSSPALLIDCLDLLSDILSRFEATVNAIADLQKAVLGAVTPLLNNARPAVRKRAVTTLGQYHQRMADLRHDVGQLLTNCSVLQLFWSRRTSLASAS